MRAISVKLEFFMVAWILVAASALIHHQTVSAAAVPTTKAYQNFGLGFKLDYPSNMTLTEINPDNVTFVAHRSQLNHTAYIAANIAVLPWIKAIGISGMFTPPNLDTLVRHIGLQVSGNSTITNKTKVVVDNTTAYLLQLQSNFKGRIVYLSVYVMLKGDIAYLISFTVTEPQRLLPLEQKMIGSFRFI
jgi:hypothetical protein